MEAIARCCISRGWDQDSSKAFLSNLIGLVWHSEFLGSSDPTLIHLSVIPGRWLGSFLFRDTDAHLRDPILSGSVSKALTTCVKAQNHFKTLCVSRGFLRGQVNFISAFRLSSRTFKFSEISHAQVSITKRYIIFLARPVYDLCISPFLISEVVPSFGRWQTVMSSNSSTSVWRCHRWRVPWIFPSPSSPWSLHESLNYAAARLVKSDVAELFDTLRRHSLDTIYNWGQRRLFGNERLPWSCPHEYLPAV